MNKEFIGFIAIALLSTAIAACLNLYLGITIGIVWGYALYEIKQAPCEQKPETPKQ